MQYDAVWDKRHAEKYCGKRELCQAEYVYACVCVRMGVRVCVEPVYECNKGVPGLR